MSEIKIQSENVINVTESFQRLFTKLDSGMKTCNYNKTNDKSHKELSNHASDLSYISAKLVMISEEIKQSIIESAQEMEALDKTLMGGN